jgi:glycosyltransferase involved in cell wall biosynthesis
MARIGILTAWASRANGGVFEAVVAHCDLVRACGHVPVVFALNDDQAAADCARFKDTAVHLYPVTGPRMVGYAPALAAGLRDADLDLLHLHGIWMFPSHAARDWAAATGRPYVVSPHGMLDPWILGRGRLKKAVARLAYERRSWRAAHAFHALTAREADDIAASTGRRGVTLVIPNAVAPTAVAREGGTEAPTVVYLGRIHPKKNINALIRAWRMARPALAPLGARLEIAGWGEAVHVAELEAELAIEPGPDISFLGPVFGERKAALLASARYLVLPSHSEGLPMVILEAWAAGTPVLMSTECNLPEGFAAGAAIDCGMTQDQIAAALTQGLSLTADAWGEMSSAGRALADRRFAPAAVARVWNDAYAGLLSATQHVAA